MRTAHLVKEPEKCFHILRNSEKEEQRKTRSKREINENIHQPCGIAPLEAVRGSGVKESMWETGMVDKEMGL